MRWDKVLLGRCLMVVLTVGTPGPECRAAEPARATSEWLLEAQRAQAKGLLLKAVELAGKAIEETPKDPRAWYFRASMLERVQKWEGADSDLTKVLELRPGDPGVIKQRGTVRLRMGSFAGAVADFDRYIELRPESQPELWQRGIALFYARRFDEGRKQFESHKNVNPHDVENAVWHFACVAKLEGFQKAREGLIPVEGDTRVPMKEIQGMFGGKVEPEAVLAAAERVELESRRDEARFYARLYLGMYEEARGNREAAAKHLAAATKGAEAFGIMGDVARLHAAWLAEEWRRGR